MDDDIFEKVIKDPEYREIADYADHEIKQMKRQINDLRVRKNQKFYEIYNRIKEETK